MLDVLNAAIVSGADGAASLKLYFEHDYKWLQASVLWGFAALNSMRVVAYVPQIIKAALDPNGASAVSCTTWGLFFASNLTTVLYALICVGDALMAIIFLGNAFACLAILVATALNRRAWHHARSANPGAPGPAAAVGRERSADPERPAPAHGAPWRRAVGARSRR